MIACTGSRANVMTWRRVSHGMKLRCQPYHHPRPKRVYHFGTDPIWRRPYAFESHHDSETYALPYTGSYTHAGWQASQPRLRRNLFPEVMILSHMYHLVASPIASAAKTLFKYSHFNTYRYHGIATAAAFLCPITMRSISVFSTFGSIASDWATYLTARCLITARKLFPTSREK
jgi:hypothetical protein